MSAPWADNATGGSPPTSSSLPQGGWVASPALKSTIVLAQCRSWLLAEEESRCRTMLNGLNQEKHAIKTSLSARSEQMQRECTTMKAQLHALRVREDHLRKELDHSSTLYASLWRDPKVSRANDDMLREKQRSNELWNELEVLIHDRNELTQTHARLETTNLVIIQNLYQTQVLLQTQQEKQRAHGLYGMDMGEEEDEATSASRGKGGRSSHLTRSTSGTMLGSALPLGSAATADAGSSSTSPTGSAADVSPLDAAVLGEVTKLNQLRTGEIGLQKKLSKFLGLREQVQTYLIKIAGFQKKLWQQQAGGGGAPQPPQRRTGGRESPSTTATASAPPTMQSHALLKKSGSKDITPSAVAGTAAASGGPNAVGPGGASSSQPIPTSPSQRRSPSGAGIDSVFSPFTPESPQHQQEATGHLGAGSLVESTSASPSSSSSSSSSAASSASSSAASSQTMQTPHQLLKPKARSISPAAAAATGTTSTSRASPSPSQSPSPVLKQQQPQQLRPSQPQQQQQQQQQQPPPPSVAPSSSPSPSHQSIARQSSIEHTQLAHLVFDARNRKVLQRVCEHFQRSGLLSARRYKKSALVIQNAFLGVELLTWVLNIGITPHRQDALILLELLLRAGLIDMIQETDTNTTRRTKKAPGDTNASSSPPSASQIAVPGSSSLVSGVGGGRTVISGTLRISDRTVFGDMKLQFALYRLRGDSSDLTKLTKSGWLHRVSRWRVTRKYFVWDADSARFAQYQSNRDAEPTKVYYLGAATVIVPVDAHGSATSGSSTGEARGGGTNLATANTSSSSVLFGAASSSSSSKFYFQLHFSPRQNDEASLLLYASTARERAEWLKILWLSGCEYPSLGRNPNAPSSSAAGGLSAASNASAAAAAAAAASSSSHSLDSDQAHHPQQLGVAPGSRPSPIHPSVLAPSSSSAAQALVGIGAFMTGGGASSPGGMWDGGGGGGGETDESSDGDEYEEEVPTEAAFEPQHHHGSDNTLDPSGHQPRQEDDTFAEYPGMSLSHRSDHQLISSQSWLSGGGTGGGLPSSSSTLSSSMSFSGGLHSARRRLSLAEKKRESDLMGVFSLRRAQHRLGLAGAWSKVHEWRRRNVQREKARLMADASESGFTRPVFTMVGEGASGVGTSQHNSADAAATAGGVPMDGLELGWTEFLTPKVAAVVAGAAEAAATPAVATTMPAAAPVAVSPSPATPAPLSTSESPAAEVDGADDGRSAHAEAADRDGGSSSTSDYNSDEDEHDEDEPDQDEDDDDEEEDGLELEDGDNELEMNELMHPETIVDDANANAGAAGAGAGAGSTDPSVTSSAQLGESEAVLRRQHFRALSRAIAALVAPAAKLATQPAAAASAASSASLSTSLSHATSSSAATPPAASPLAPHPLTLLLASFVRGFHDLYSGALEMDGGNQAGGTAASSSSSSTSSSASAVHAGPKGWSAVQRSASASVDVDAVPGSTPAPDARRARERGESAAATPTSAGASAAGGGVGLTLDLPSSPSHASLPPVLASLAAAGVGVPTAAYPFPRHARSVLAAAKEDVRVFLQAFTQLMLDALRACEDQMRGQALRQAAAAATSAAGTKDGTTPSAGQRRRRRRAASHQRRPHDPTLRRLEREFLLLSRLVSQLVSHHVLSLVHRSLFPLYAVTAHRKTGVLQEAIHQNRQLGFEEMGLSEDLIVIAPTKDNRTTGATPATTTTDAQPDGQVDSAGDKGTTISYDHAISTFRSLSSLSSPVDKLHCVVGVAKAICACVDQAKQQQQRAQRRPEDGHADALPASPVVIGADDLLLLFTYLLLQTDVPHVWAELALLSDFIPDHQRCTMHGYYLATFTAAAELLMSDQFADTIKQREGNHGQQQQQLQPRQQQGQDGAGPGDGSNPAQRQ